MLKNIAVATLVAVILGAGSIDTKDLSGNVNYPKQIVESLFIK